MVKKLPFLLTIFALALWVIPASALVSGPFTGTGTFDSLPVSATATFITSTDTVEVQVYNNIANPTAVIQCLSDLGFVLSTGETTGSISSFSAQERDIASGGSYTTAAATTTNWVLNNAVDFGAIGAGLKLNDLGSGEPENTIIGQDDNNGSGSYSAANTSIAGNGPHNPLWFGDAANPVTFILDVPGVTDATAVTFVQFSFGTVAGNNVNVPLPPGALLMGSGLLGLVLVRWRRV